MDSLSTGPNARAHVGDTVDSNSAWWTVFDANALTWEPKFASHSFPNHPHMDTMVIVRGVEQGSLTVSLLCDHPPTELQIERLQGFVFVEPSGATEGASVSACPATCVAGGAVSNVEAGTADIGGDRVEMIFHSGGHVDSGAVRLTHPGGTSSWTLPTAGLNDWIEFQGAPGHYRLEVDAVKPYSDTNRGPYMGLVAGWRLAEGFSA